MSRQVAAQLESELDIPVNVINAVGGSGVTGHSRGALARPDGYTLTMITVELNILHWRGLTNVTPKDFAPLVLLNRDSAALFVRTDSPYHTLDDLEAAIRRQDELFRDILTSEAFDSVGEEHFGPMIFPSVIGGLLFVCLLTIVVSSLSERGRNEPGGPPDAAGLSSESRGHVIATLLAIVWYLLLVEHAGFLLTVFPMLAALMVRFRINGLLAVGLVAYYL
ncbi:MAG: tripartite tricarboxylate transporter substrate-binding protein, partial [Planctomycetota bacterium]